MAKLLSNTRIYGTGTVDTQLFVGGLTGSISTNTGALQVIGGAGFGGSIFVGGVVTATTFVGNLTGNLSGGTAGQLVYQSALNTTAFAGPGTVGQILTSNGTSGPLYVNTGSVYVGRAAFADTVSGAGFSDSVNGGLAGQILIQNGTSSTTFISTASAGSLLQIGVNTATFVTTSSVYVNSAVNAQTLFGGAAGQLVYQSGAGTTAFAGPGTTGQLLVSAGTSAPVYTNTSTIQVGFSANLLGGTAGQLVYQTGGNATAFAGPGTAGQILTSGGTGAPTYVSTGSIYVGRAVIADSATGSAGTVNTQLRTTSADHFLTFVDSNNTTPTAESLYTTSSFVVNPATGNVGVNISPVSKLHVGGDVRFTGITTVTNTTTATSTSTGALRVEGGIGVAESVYIGKDLNVKSVSTLNEIRYQNSFKQTFNYHYSFNTYLNIGETQKIFQIIPSGDSQNYGIVGKIYVQSGDNSQILDVEFSLRSNVTPDLSWEIYYNDSLNGIITPYVKPVLWTKETTTAGFIFGIEGLVNSIQMASVSLDVYNRDASYYNNVTFLTDPEVSVIDAGYSSNDGVLRERTIGTSEKEILLTTNATSTTTGALQVVGGVGIGGNVYAGGNGFFGGVVTATTFFGALTGTASAATNIAGGTAGQLHYQSAPGVTAFAGPGTAGQLLVSAGTSAPTYTNTGSIYVGFANQSNNLLAGILGQIPYQTAAGNTAFIGTGTNGSLLQMGANTATFVATSTIYVNRSVLSDNDSGGAAGGLRYQTGANASTFLSIGTAGQLLRVNSGATAPEWVSTGSVYAGSAVSSQNIFGGTAGQLVYQSAAGTTAFAGPGSAGNVLTSGGTGAPTYVTTGSLYVGRALVADSASGSAGSATNLSGGSLGQIPYQLAAGSTAFIGTGTNGSILQMGANTATFVTTASIYVNSAVNAQNLFGGTTGQLVYQSGVGTTAFVGPGTAGQLLVSNGASAPVYTSTSSIYVNRSVLSDNDSGGAAGGLRYQTGANASTFLSIGTAGQLLRVNSGATAPEWVSTGSVYAAAAVSSQNLFGGTAGQLVYQSAAGTTAFAGPGSAGNVLTSGGTGAPTYVTTGSLYVGRALIADSASGSAGSANNLSGGSLGQIPYQLAAGSTAFIGTGTQGSILQMGANTATFVTTSSIYVNSSVNSQNLFGGSGGSIPYQSAANATAMLGIGGNNSILVSNGSVPSWSTNPTIGGNLVVVGNLTVQGTTTIVDSTVTNISDPIVTIGTGANNTIPVSDDGKDRGIAFAWTGTQAGLNTGRTGFFGFDRSSLYFTFITSASITNEVVSPSGGTTRGAIDANLAGGTTGQLVYQSAADTTAFVGPGTAGQILVSAGAAAPTYTNTSSIYVNSAVNAQTLFGGTAGQLVYQSAAGVTAFAGPGTAGQLLVSAGTSAPTYTSTGSIYVGRAVLSDSASSATTANAATNIAGGTAGQVPYQTGVGATSFFGPGTAGQILVSAGTSAPTYTSTSSIYVNRSVLSDNDSGGAAGGLRYQTGANASTFLSIGTAGQLLRVNSGATAPEWVSTGSVYAAAAVSSQNIFGGTAGQLVYQSAAGTTAFTGPGTAGQILVSAGTSAPTYTNTASIYVGFANQANNLIGGSANQFAYQSAANTTAFISTGSMYVGFSNASNNILGGTAGQLHVQSAANTTVFVGPGTAGQILVSAGAASPVYTSTGSIYVGFANQANNLLAGTAGQLVYQSAAGTTAFAGPGTAGQLLVSGGTSAPTYTNTSSIQVGFAANLLGGSANQFAYQTGANATAFVSTGSMYVGRAALADAVTGGVTSTNNLSGGSLGQIPYQLAAGSTAFIGTGTNGSILQMGANTATFVTTSSVYVNSAVNSQNVFGGSAGQLVYQSAAGVTAFAGPGTSGQILTSGGTTAPVYVNTSNVYVGGSISSQNLFGGTAGQLHYQSAAGVTAFVGPGTAGQILTSNGAAAPVYTNTASIYVNNAVTADNVKTILQTANASYYPTFVDANNAAATAEALYTTSTFFINPATRRVGIGASSLDDFLTVGQTTSAFNIGGVTVKAYTEPQLNQYHNIGFSTLYNSYGNIGLLAYLNGDSLSLNTNVFYFGGYNNTADAYLQLFGNKVHVAGNGNVGINNISPASKLDVTGDARIGGITTVTNTTGVSSTITGALQVVSGGLGVGGGGFFGGVVTATQFVGTFSGAVNSLAGGSLGQIPYQLAAGSTAFIGTGTNGSILQMGANTATFVATSTIYVNRAVLADNDSGGAAGGLRYQTGANASTFLSIGTAGQLLRVNSGATAPEWIGTASVYVNSAVNAQTLFGGTAGQLVYQSAAGTTAFAGPGTAGQLLVSAGTSAPTYTSTGSIYVGFANASNNLLAGTAGQIPYQGGANSTLFAGPGSSGQLLQSNGTAGPSFVNTSTLYVGNADLAKNVIGGAQGQILFQSGANATTFLSTSTPGAILVQGANNPSFASTGSVYVGNAVSANNLRDGSAGAIPYQSAPGTTLFLTGTAGQILVSNGTSAPSFTGPGTAGQVLTSNGTSGPVYVNTGTLYVGRAVLADSATVATRADNISGGSLGQIPYQLASGSTAFIGTGTNGTLLQMGANTATFVSTTTIQVGAAANLLAGVAGSIPYQSAANTTAMLGIGGSNSILVSNGSLPSWTTSPTIGGNVTIVGNLTVQGTTVVVDSTVTNVSDPIITIGTGANNTIPVSDDGKDRGIAFVWTGTQAGLNTGRTGFFGFDRSSLYFTFITSATITNEVVAPAGGTTRGAIDANLAGGTAGQLVYQSAADTTAFAGPGTAGQVLTSNGTSGPVYVTTTTLYVGRALIADVASGGAATANDINGGTAGQLLYQIAAGDTGFVGPGTAGQILVSNGAAAPVYTNTASIQVGASANVLGGTAGQIVYQSASNTTAFAGPGTSGQILTSGGTGAPTYVSTGSIYVGFANASNNILGGTTGQLHYQSAANTTAFVGPGNAGQLLQSNGVAAPTYVNTTSVFVGAAVDVLGGTVGQLLYQIAANDTGFVGPGTAGQLLVSAGASAPVYTNTSSIQVGFAANLLGGTANQFAYQTGPNTTAFISTGSMYVGFANQANNLLGGTAGQLVYQSAAGTTAFAGPGSAGNVLTSGGTGAPSYVTTTSLYVGRAVTADSVSGAVANLSGGILGQIPYQLAAGSTAFIGTGTNGTILRMGANTATFVATSTIYVNSAVNAQTLFGGTTGQLVYQSGAGVTAFAGPGTAGQLLVSAGASAPVYTNTGSIYVGFANQSNNLLGGILGQIAYQTAAGTTAFIGTGTNGSILQMGANTATFVTTANIYVNSSVNTQNLFGGTAGQLHYQSAAGVTAFAGPGTAGQVLTSGGTGAPAYVTTTSLYVGRALVADSASGSAGSATNLSGGILGQIPYQLAAGSTAFIGTGTNGSILQMGANTATFVATSTIYVNSAVNAQNLFGGTAGQLHYQSAAGVTAFAGPGTAGQVLTSGGTGAPAYVTTTTLYVGRAVSADNATGNAGTVSTQLQTTNASYFLTFVDSNNATATAEQLWTTSTFLVNPSTGNTTVGSTSAGTHKFSVRTAITAPGTDGLAVEAGNTGTFIRPWLSSGNYNPAVQINDSGIIFSNNSQGVGNLFIGPWSTTSTGIRISSAGSIVSTTVFGNGIPATSTQTGALQIVGGLGVWAGSFFGGTVTATNVFISTALGVGTAPSTTAGEIRASNEITAYFSDRRLKENIQVIDDALVKVLSLNGVTYNPNDLALEFGYDKSKKLVGLLADEVYAVLPEAVRIAPFDADEHGNSKSGNNYQTIQYEKVVPLLVEAVKEQQKIIENLTNELRFIKENFVQKST